MASPLLTGHHAMATVKLNSYADVQKFISDAMTKNGSSAANAPHKNFWQTLTYDQFVNGNVPGVKDPASQQLMRILVPGDSKASNLILALQGATGTLFDPNTGDFGIMPADGTTPFTADQIASIADWIDRNCPE
jgi:hypothetical protein